MTQPPHMLRIVDDMFDFFKTYDVEDTIQHRIWYLTWYRGEIKKEKDRRIRYERRRMIRELNRAILKLKVMQLFE